MSRISALTSAAVEQLASGSLPNFAGSGLFEQSIENGADDVLHLYYTPTDAPDDPLVLIRNPDDDLLLPEALRAHPRQALHRILSFAQRTRNMPIVVPRSWKPYRDNDKVGFFAVPLGAAGSPRWVAQVHLQGTFDIGLLGITTTQEKQILSDFEMPAKTYHSVRSAWQSHLRTALVAMQGPAAQKPTAGSAGVEVVLDNAMPSEGLSKSLTLSEWLPSLTPAQAEFVDAPVNRSIRLRGPAGSGKTLTMAIKVVREAQAAKETGSDVRILFATHSWSLAGEVDDLIRTLSEYGDLDNITVLPLIAVAEEILPSGLSAEGLELIGDDSLAGKSLQLAQIRDVIREFKETDWITFRSNTTSDFQGRIDSELEVDVTGLAWDLLIEFGCVLGADGIFPSFNAEARYLRLPRAPWMMNLSSDGEKRVVYALYERFWTALQERSLITSDQLLNDFLNYLETFAWNHRRRVEGFDLIFVDEFHLFNIQERQTLRYLSNDTGSYPKIFMSLDPRQSPWEVYVDTDISTSETPQDEELDEVRTVDIPTVHRLTPQVLELVKHVHHEFPNLDLGADWEVPISEVESLASPGPRPSLFLADTQADEEIAIYRAINDIYSAGSQFALAILDEDRFPHYLQLMQRVSSSGKFKVVTITDRDDVGLLKSHKRGVVVGPAEYLAGLQFDSVLVAGLPDMNSTSAHQSYRRGRNLSLLYLALTRATRDVRIFANDDYSGVPGILERAVERGILGKFRYQA
jgi:hypothetical protein